MKLYFFIALFLSSLSFSTHAAKANPLTIIAKEPVSMMDLGIIKLNTYLANPNQPSLRGATIGAKYNASKGTIDIKVSMPVSKASKSACKDVIKNTKKLFVKSLGKRKISNIDYYFQHEGTGYSRKIDWNKVARHVIITGIALTRKNFQDSVYCQSNLMQDKVTF